MGYLKSFFADFIELTRAYALAMTFASCFVIYSYANYSEEFSFLNFILIVIALCCVHLGANLFDDYVDVRLKLKDGIALSDIKFSSLIPKARLIIEGKYSLRKVEFVFSFLFLIALAIGVYFINESGAVVGLFMLAGAVLALFYPISSKFYLAEIVVGLIYGPLVIMGGYYALCSEFNSNLFLFSLAIFFTTQVLLHTHSLMDWEIDIKDGKKTLCALLKTKQKAINALRTLIILSYSIIFLGVILLRFNPHMLYCFLTLPIAVKLVESMEDYINVKDVEFCPKWYYGFFEGWDKIRERKIDFFMYRFYLARNFALFFALFASIGAMV